MSAIAIAPTMAIPIDASFAALSASPNLASTTTVHVLNFDFSTDPSGPIVDPVIQVGDTIHWVFDTNFHSVTSPAGSAEAFDSGVQFSTGATFDHTFSQAGTFAYFCAIHGFDAGGGNVGGMSGFVTVLAVPEPTSLLSLVGIASLVRRRR